MPSQYRVWLKIQEEGQQPLLCHASKYPEHIETVIAKLEQALARAKQLRGNPGVHKCPLCGSVMVRRTGKYGSFYTCTKQKCGGKRNGNGSVPQSVMDQLEAQPEETWSDNILDNIEIE